MSIGLIALINNSCSVELLVDSVLPVTDSCILPVEPLHEAGVVVPLSAKIGSTPEERTKNPTDIVRTNDFMLQKS